MRSHLHCRWAIKIGLTLVLCLIPKFALCHSESATGTGAVALTNIPKFFVELRQNLRRMIDRKLGAATWNTENLDSSSKNIENDIKNYLERHKIEKIPWQTRHEHSSISHVNVDDIGGDDATKKDFGSKTNRNLKKQSPFLDTTAPDENKKRSEDELTRELMDFLEGKEPEYLKANKYNPRWLYTNLGLGK